MLRSSGDPLQLIQSVKDVVRTLDPNLPMLHTMSYEDFYLNQAVKGPRIAIKLVGSMGVVGLLLAIAGLYGLVAYNVAAEPARSAYALLLARQARTCCAW